MNSGFLESALQKARMRQTAGEYAAECARLSALCGIFGWLVSGLVHGEMLFTLFHGFLVAVLAFLCMLFFPFLRMQRFGQQIEAELPLFLRSLAAELNMRIPLERALEHAADTHPGILAEDIHRVLSEHREKGVPLQEALFLLGERVHSRNVKRALLQLAHVLEQGNATGGKNVARIASELLSQQKSAIKEYSGKIAVFSLLFIAVSAIIPALFQSFVIVGSVVLKLPFTPLQVLVIVGVLFPLADAAVYLYIKSKSPVFLEA